MIEGILAIAVAVWFYQTAMRMKVAEPLKWAAMGAGIYYLTVFLWVWFNQSPVMESLHHQSLGLGVFIHYLGSALGLFAAWLLHRYGLMVKARGK